MKKIFILLAVALISALAVTVFYISAKKAEDVLYPVKFSEEVGAAAMEFGVPEATVFAVIKCESNFDPNAVSSAGAVGLMQLLPDTYEWLCLLEGKTGDPDDLYDPMTNIRYGTKLLAYLHDERYGGDWRAVHAAYNAGWGRVDRWIEEGRMDDIPFRETREYVKLIEKAKEIYQNKLKAQD